MRKDTSPAERCTGESALGEVTGITGDKGLQ